MQSDEDRNVWEKKSGLDSFDSLNGYISLFLPEQRFKIQTSLSCFYKA